MEKDPLNYEQTRNSIMISDLTTQMESMKTQENVDTIYEETLSSYSERLSGRLHEKK